ncbi:hypothetical protein IWW50_001501 [Coemansia erecta]|nr:hypothetical protein GGF43_003914 [Coemansia sp. RSA 2618]KAJ2828218.1 hypothetical protein IWW50_001501 [Coemansia erecta]
MFAKVTALAFTVALASAQAPAPEAKADSKPAPARGGGGSGYYQNNAPQQVPVVVANTVAQNAAAAEPTVTETVTNGASKLGNIGMSVVALAGSALAASYF